MTVSLVSRSPLVPLLALAQPQGVLHKGPHDNYLLLVEDNDDDAMLTLRALKRLGIGLDVVTVKDGAAAIDVLHGDGSKDHLPCLVLLDLKLPKLDGAEVLSRLRASPETQDLPVLVLSSSKEALERLRTQDLGALDYVIKSYHLDGFAQSLEQIKAYCS